MIVLFTRRGIYKIIDFFPVYDKIITIRKCNAEAKMFGISKARGGWCKPLE